MADDKKKLYVGNLDRGVKEEDLRAAFEEYGQIEEAALIMDQNTGESKGFAFITFVNEEDAAKAASAMDGKDMKGKPMKVNEARPRE